MTAQHIQNVDEQEWPKPPLMYAGLFREPAYTHPIDLYLEDEPEPE